MKYLQIGILLYIKIKKKTLLGLHWHCDSPNCSSYNHNSTGKRMKKKKRKRNIQ